MNIYLDSKKHILIQRIEPYLNKNNIFFSRNINECDIQLSLVHYRNLTKLPTVARLDGIYYDKEINYISKNKPISKLHTTANGIIYQSKFSKTMCDKYLLPRHTKIYDIIYNGIEENWCGGFKEHDGINVICTSKWRRWKRLKEIIDVFLEYLKFYPNSTLHILGKLHENKIVNHKNIKYYGMLKFNKMKEIYRVGDMFIHIAKNDPCPKTVSEAIGSGMPVIVTNAGGGSTEMASLTDGCIIVDGDEISYEADYVYQDKWNELTSELKNKLVVSMCEIANDKRRIILPKKLNINYTAKKYLEILEMVVKRG